jgi:hypothetical protein
MNVQGFRGRIMLRKFVDTDEPHELHGDKTRKRDDMNA